MLRLTWIPVTEIVLLFAAPSAVSSQQKEHYPPIHPSTYSIIQQTDDLRQERKFPQASKLISAYLKSHPNSSDAFAAFARVQRDLGDTAGSEHSLNYALAISPGSVVANLDLGNFLLAEQRYEEALTRFEAVLASDVRNLHARSGELSAATNLALQIRAHGDQEGSLAVLERARRSLPDDPVLLTNIGIQAELVHHLHEAADALKEAFRIAPGDPKVLYALARVETDLDQLPLSEKHLRAYLTARPDDASAHYGLGRVLHMQQHNDVATMELECSIALQPVQTESYYLLGQIALDEDQSEKAKALFLKTLSRESNHGGSLTGMGILMYREKNYEKAAEYLSEAIVSSPEYQPAHYYYGLTLGRLGKKDESNAELKRALDLVYEQQRKDKPITNQ